MSWDPTDLEVRAVVFDLFYTLVDPGGARPPGYGGIPAIAEILGLELDFFEEWWTDRIEEFGVTPVSPVDEIVELARQRRIVLSPGDVADIDRALGHPQDEALRSPVAGVLATLSRLRRAQLGIGVLSNAHARDVRGWSESPLAVLVDAPCMSCFIGAAKPDPAAYEQVLDRLGVAASEAVFVGDGGHDELGGARRIGFGGVVGVTGPAVRSSFRTRQEQQSVVEAADAVVEDVTELVSLLGVPD